MNLSLKNMCVLFAASVALVLASGSIAFAESQSPEGTQDTSQESIITGWVETGTATYFYTKDGTQVTGWKTIKGKAYYFKKNGKLVTNKIIKATKALRVMWAKTAQKLLTKPRAKQLHSSRNTRKTTGLNTRS